MGLHAASNFFGSDSICVLAICQLVPEFLGSALSCLQGVFYSSREQGGGGAGGLL